MNIKTLQVAENVKAKHPGHGGSEQQIESAIFTVRKKLSVPKFLVKFSMALATALLFFIPAPLAFVLLLLIVNNLVNKLNKLSRNAGCKSALKRHTKTHSETGLKMKNKYYDIAGNHIGFGD